MNHNRFSRREALAAIAATASMPLLSACAQSLAAAQPAGTPAAPRRGSQAQAQSLLDSIADNLLQLFPEAATSLGVDTGERRKLRYELADRSALGQQRIANTLRADLARLNAFDAGGLDFDMRTNFEVVRSAYSTALQGFAFPYGDVPVGYNSWRNTPYVVIQNTGAYLDVPRFLDSDHPVNNVADAEAYLARLQSYPKQLDGELGRIQSARAMGLVPPSFLLDKAIPQLELSLKNAREGGGLVESLVRRTREKNIPGNWEDLALAITRQEVAPALERQIAELRAERAVATDAPGMWARPMGDEYYRWALKSATTTDLSPDEIHRMGLQEVEALHARMDVILKEIGYASGTVGERMQALADDPRYKFAEGDAGRAEIMAFIQERLEWIKAQMPRAFKTLANPNMEVRRLPPEEEPGAPGAYGGAGSIDGSIPGRFWINLRTTDLHRKYDLADLTYHEAIPGHIWQGESPRGLPLIRRMLGFNAYSEGWALYAEQLADELGAYDSFPVGRLGYLQSLAFRACRMVVDTGLHAKRWTRQQAVDFFVNVNGSKAEEVASEVDRYCSWPGQATGYKLGHSRIVALRDKAKAELGAKFDLRAFNDTVVLNGNMPLDVLEKNVDLYIAETKAS